MLKEQELPRVLWAASACFLGRVSPLGAVLLPVSGFTLETFLHLWDQHERLPHCTSSCSPSKSPQWDSPPSLSLLNVGEDTNPGRPHWSPFTSLPHFCQRSVQWLTRFYMEDLHHRLHYYICPGERRNISPSEFCLPGVGSLLSSTCKWFLSFLEIL